MNNRDHKPNPKCRLIQDKMSAVLMQEPHKSLLSVMFEYDYKNELDYKTMFQYIWAIEELHSIVNIDIKAPLKNEALSEDLRKQGNKFYKEKKFQKALDKYNISIIEALHPDLTQEESSAEIGKLNNNQDEFKFKALALAFANRSAVLFELEQYEKSIADINCAFKFGYPILQHCKLAERKIKCLIALKKPKEAKALLQTTIALLSSMKLDNKVKSYEELLAVCPRNLSSTTENELLFTNRNPTPPVLNDVNPKIPAFSSALGLTYSKERGRSVVATRDIKPGELIGVEAPYVSTLNSQDWRKFCCVCHAQCLIPLPCTQCNLVIFCSESCRSAGYSKFHRVECSVLPTLVELFPGHLPSTAYRVLANIPFTLLKSIVPKLENERCEKTRQSQGFNDQEVYDSLNYSTIFHLEGSFSSRIFNDLLNITCVSFILTKLLIKSNSYFIDEQGKVFEPFLSDIVLVASTLCLHLTNFIPNAMAMLAPLNMTSDELYNQGIGIYPAISLINHSCHRSVTQIVFGCHQATYSVSFIPEGSEILISYTQPFYMNNYYFRRLELLQVYNFECNCEACTNDWPLLKFIEIMPKLKRPEKMILRGTTNEMAKLDPNKIGTIMQYMEKLKQEFMNYYTTSSNQKLDAHRIIAIEVLEFLGRFADMPCSLVVYAQVWLETNLQPWNMPAYLRK